MLDFPNSPTTNQVFTAGGMSWTWDGVKWVSGAAGGAYLPLSGGTVSGPLTVTGTTTLQGNEIFNGSATFGSSVQFNATASFGSTMSVTGTATFNGQVNVHNYLVANNITSSGSAAWLGCYDRGNSGGTTANQFALYRDGNIGYLWMQEAGTAMSFATNGAATIPSTLTVTLGTTCNGSTPLTSNGNGNNYPVVTSNPSSQHCLISQTVNGVRQWLAGTWTNGSYYLYDASGGGPRLTIDTNGGTAFGANNGYAWIGANGWWQGSGSCEFSPRGGAGAIEVYGGTTNGGWAIYARVDNWQTYNMVLLYSTTVNGSITTNGTNAFFNTSCDARLKDNIRALSSEIDVGGIIDTLKPVAFEWKGYEFRTLGEPAVEDVTLADGREIPGKPAVEGKLVRVEARTDHGFIAQELYQVLPGIVHKPDNDEEPMQADYSKLAPYVIAELQALRRRVAELEGRT